MAVINPVVMFRGAASTTSTTLYTVPASTVSTVTSIVVTNTAASSATFSILFDGVAAFGTTTLAANSTGIFDVKQVLAATKTITGLASATTVNFHISGTEKV